MPMPFFRRLSLVVMLLPTLPVLAADAYPYTDFGVAFSKDEAWYRQCIRVEKAVAPPLAKGAAKSPDCDAETLYYTKLHQAATSPAQWESVHACASANGDTSVLMMLYANGLGVARDTDVAIHYACRRSPRRQKWNRVSPTWRRCRLMGKSSTSATTLPAVAWAPSARRYAKIRTHG